MAFMNVEVLTTTASAEAIVGEDAGYKAKTSTGLQRTRGGKTFYPYWVFYKGAIPAEIAADRYIMTVVCPDTIPYGIPTYESIAMA